MTPGFWPASPSDSRCVTWHSRASVSWPAKQIELPRRLNETVYAEPSEQCLKRSGGLFLPVCSRWENRRTERLGEPSRSNSDPQQRLCLQPVPSQSGLSQKQGEFSGVLTTAPTTATNIRMGYLLCARSYTKGWLCNIFLEHVASQKIAATSHDAQCFLRHAVVGYVPVLNSKLLAVGGCGSQSVYLTEPCRNECSALKL